MRIFRVVHRFPMAFILGFLLRCFMNLYDCELVDENSFFAWKEEINPDYPAKGQALFEVRFRIVFVLWLTCLIYVTLLLRLTLFSTCFGIVSFSLVY